MKKLLYLIPIFCLLLTPLFSGDENTVYITIGQDAFGPMQNILRLQTKDQETMLPQLMARNGVVLTRIPAKQIPTLSNLMHRDFDRCAGFIAYDSYESALAGLAGPVNRNQKAVTYTLDNATVANTMVAAATETEILTVITQLSSYYNRYYTTTTAVDAANWLKSHWESMAAGRSDVTVELFNHSWAQPSVILTITGSTLPSEVVVIGGHLDSINGGASGLAPGADDDASGVATVSEAIRVAMQENYKPQRTLKFMAYAAEEVGLRGSGDIAASFSANGINVVGAYQLDMDNYNGSANDIYLIQDNTNAAQNNFLAQLIDTYVGVSRSTTSCGYACSDHASWFNQGYVVSFPFEAQFGQYSPYIHTANDTLANSGGDAAHAVKFARLTLAYMAELAKGDFSGGGPGGNIPPNANFTHNTNLLTANFDASSSSDADGAITSYSWNYGDGNNGIGVTPSHNYSVNGTYSVTLIVTDDGGATDQFTSSVTVNDGTSWTQITSDNFETGWGNFNDGGTDVRRSINDAAFAHSGSYCIRLQDNSGAASSMFTNSLNLTGYSELEVSFWFYASSMENGEDFLVEYNSGSGWVSLGSYVAGTHFSNNGFYNPTFSANSGSLNFTANAQVRIRCDASANDDRIYVDQVVISAR